MEGGVKIDMCAPLTPPFALCGRWVVENQVGVKDLVIKDTEAKQTVYIYGCKNSVVTVDGKVNNITLDKCVKTAVVFQDVVAALEVVNCVSVEVQCKGSAPTMAVDNTSGCQLYLGPHSLGASITTAKSSEVNVLVPGEGEGADDVRHPSLPPLPLTGLGCKREADRVGLGSRSSMRCQSSLCTSLREDDSRPLQSHTLGAENVNRSCTRRDSSMKRGPCSWKGRDEEITAQ